MGGRGGRGGDDKREGTWGIDPHLLSPLIKIEGATGKKADILFLCNCRMGRKGKEIEKMFNLSRNGKYKLYYNSDKESRGVAIAIKASIFHVVQSAQQNVSPLQSQISL